MRPAAQSQGAAGVFRLRSNGQADEWRIQLPQPAALFPELDLSEVGPVARFRGWRASDLTHCEEVTSKILRESSIKSSELRCPSRFDRITTPNCRSGKRYSTLL